ncbi:uncharacterized protein Z519_01401 [Cladophialophora bantiana CBS 173.52]|uniref:Zn(2)-C6 fungal-type domain-containing protein n=1 Tax=Cladophialophora bantiana (strain ATCC 10958 / CBS 173.52 / CDC B-1940 / NIH 8579) TaxID=1442370 RepID=A0A0D2GHG9_CLAB1|nr:uncharacterized protein Z519_01401 [Cladophialophora bantiana CBS 173.52]KIW97817.1 hypothetical protein Z519_01401 [Cladophialophora bantiana CBS 173.52]
MSGSPPPEPPAEPPQTAGRRRKRSRSHTPPTTTTAAAASPITPLDTTAPRPSTLPRGGETITELAVQPGPYALNYPLPPASYQSASSLPSTSISAPSPRLALSPVSPRATRKPKAHVASACVNCKKKHLRCDSSRPCRRCVQSGKEDSCVDVEHKKRGRPPLKPDDASARRPGFEAALSPVPGRLGEPRRFADQSIFPPAAAYHPIRPLGTTNFRPGRAASSIFTLHAPPSISPSLATAEGTFVPSSSRQYPAGIAPMPGQAPSPYNPSHPESAFPSMTYAGGYNYPSQQGQVGTSGYYTSNPIFPPRPSPLPADQLPPLQMSSSLQLPPILPAPSAPIDPAIVQQLPQQTQPSARGEPGSRNDGTQEPDPKRPKMDIQGILGPRND